LLVLPFVAAVADDPDDKEIARLVKQLSSSDFRIREVATKRLAEIGQPALDALNKAKDTLEMRRRAEAVIVAIEVNLYGPELRLSGHATSISADGKRLVTIDGKTVRLWDTYTGKVLPVFEGHTDRVNDAALSPDGTQVLSASGFQDLGAVRPRGDHSVRLWDAQTGKELCKYQGHLTVVSSVAFGPEGQAISGDSYGCMHLWDVKTGHTIRIFVCHDHPRGLDAADQEIGSLPVRVTYSEKAKLAVTCGVYVHIRLWNLETGKEVRKFYQRDPAYVCFSPDGKRVAGALNSMVRVWDVDTGKELWGEHVSRLEGPTHVAFSPDGQRIVTSNSDGTVRILNVVNRTELYRSERRFENTFSSTFFPDGQRIASVYGDRSAVRIWRTPH
jgi:WD40 repeat protein